MPTGNLKISHNFSGETGYVIMVPKKTTAPLADVVCTIDGVTNQTRKVYAAPHSQTSVLIENLFHEWYFIKFYRSLDGVSLDQEILTLAGNATSGAIYPITRFEYIVGRGEGELYIWSDPIPGDVGLRDERLLNKTYWVEERGTGSLLQQNPSEEIIDRSDEGGGFDFVQEGKSFEAGGVYVVTMIEKVDLTGEGGGGGSDYNDILILDVNQDFDPATMNGKLLIAQFPGNIGLLNFPNLSTLADCKFKLQSHFAFQRYVKMQFDVGDSITFLNQDLNVLYLGRGEFIECLIRDNVIYVMGYDGEYRRLGLRVWADKQELNSLLANGTQYNQSEYPRLMQFVDSLPSANVVSEATWASSQTINGKTVYPNKGLFARDDVAGKIRVPDMRNMHIRALKYLDGTSDSERLINKPGGYQIDRVGPHRHNDVPKKINDIDRGTNGANSLFSLDDSDDTSNAGEGISADTRGENIGLIPLIII